jgi:hypothetical protein
VPGDEATVGVVVCLAERPAEGGLGGEVHVAEEELADEGFGWGGGGFLFFLALFDYVLDAVVELNCVSNADRIARMIALT